MLRYASWAALALVTVGLACSAAGQSPSPTSTETAAPSDASPAVGIPATDEELAELVAGNNAFALDVYHQLADAEAPDNLFFSPHSIATALAMTWAGAEGETASAMAGTLHITMPAERAHAAFQRLAHELASRSEGGEADETGDRFELTVANALWPQAGYPFLDAFMALEREYYGADPTTVDYENATEDARATINGWVSERTNERIPELIQSGILNADVRLVLTNAIYFNASWAEPFNPDNTRPGVFHTPGGEVAVPLMERRLRAGSARVGDVTVVEVSYLGGEVAMTILMPAEGELAAFETMLTSERLDALLGALSYGRVDLTMPKFESGSAMSLVDVLSSLGMGIVFDRARADFSGMTGTNDLYVSEVVHEANLTVDETGTEAAAATAVIMSTRSVEREPERIVVDRPFVYLIRDRATGAVLFMGRLANPT